MWDKKKIEEANKPQVAAMSDEELAVLGKLIREEQARRIKDDIDKLGG